MILAFTGTHFGMSDIQLQEVYFLMRDIIHPNETTLIHGGCVGADADVHKLGLIIGTKIEVYPSNIKPMWAENWDWEECDAANVIHRPMRPLTRNEIMMERADIVIAAPRRMEEERRSGTWHAIRCAKRLQRRPFKVRKRILIVWRDGNIQEHDGTDIKSFTGEHPNPHRTL